MNETVPPIELRPSEAWAWQAIRDGKVADFHARLGNIDPCNGSGWDQARELRPEFLKCLAFSAAFRSQVPPEGVRIVGAWVSGLLDWDGVRLAHPWRVERARIDGKLCLSRAHTSDDLSFRGSTCAGCELVDARVDGSLDLSAATVAGAVDLSRAEIGLHANFADLTCSRLLAASVRIGRDTDLDRVQCDELLLQDAVSGGALLLRKAQVAAANFRRARFSGHANLSHLKCKGYLDLEGVDVGSDLFLNFDVRARDDAGVGSLSLAGARVQGVVSMKALTCKGDVNLDGLNLREDLILSNGRLNTLDAVAVVCGGQVVMKALTCTGAADFQSLQVATDVLMERSRFADSFGLMSAKIAADLMMEKARFAGDVDLQAIEVSGDVAMPGARFGAGLSLRHASIGLALDMQRIRVRGSLRMYRAQASSIDLSGADISGPVLMNRARASSILLVGAKCASVEMRFSEIDNYLDFTGVKLSGPLDMESSQIGDDVFLQDKAYFEDIHLRDVRVGGTLVARRAQFHGKITAHWMMAKYVWLHANARFEDAVELRGATIDANLILGGAHIAQRLELEGCKIGSTLAIGSPEHGFPTWGPDCELNLRDALVRTLQVTEVGPGDAAWPPRIYLSGFIYDRVSGSSHKWLETWLDRDSTHSAQPYRQAAQVLAGQGDARRADFLLFEGRKWQRRNAPHLRRALDWAAELTIGYGIGARYFYSLVPATVLTLIGAAVFAETVQAHWTYPGAAALFSLDQLLPIIDVNPGAGDIAKKLTGALQWYLAFHRACGFLLGTFIIAGLTGLTKR